MPRTFKIYVHIPLNAKNQAQFRFNEETMYLRDLHLTWEDVTYQDLGWISLYETCTLITVKSFLRIRRFFNELGKEFDRWL